jgi:hypothetical protein
MKDEEWKKFKVRLCFLPSLRIFSRGEKKASERERGKEKFEVMIQRRRKINIPKKQSINMCSSIITFMGNVSKTSTERDGKEEMCNNRED